jgi:hypothetical protein
LRDLGLAGENDHVDADSLIFVLHAIGAEMERAFRGNRRSRLHPEHETVKGQDHFLIGIEKERLVPRETVEARGQKAASCPRFGSLAIPDMA